MERLCRKLRALKMPRNLYDLLRSWLDARVFCVVVDGVCSDPLPLENSVYQGTILGPPLWNQHFSDSRNATAAEGYVETVYADDMNAFKQFDQHIEHEDIFDDLKRCQAELHKWGVGNRVSFDPSKEGFHILHRRFPSYSEFKILGVLFDSQLKMHSAVRELAVQAGWRLKALFRARKYFSVNQMFMLCKSQVLSYVESGSVAFVHAPVTTMSPIDRFFFVYVFIALASAEGALVHKTPSMDNSGLANQRLYVLAALFAER